MEKEYFDSQWMKLQNACEKKYTQTNKDILDKRVYRGLNPTSKEWDNTIEHYISDTQHWLPSVKQVAAFIIDGRKSRTVDHYVNCQTCGGEGILFLRRDHPLVLKEIKNKGTSKHIGIVGCGCDNTPAWHRENQFYIGPPEARKPVGKRKPTATIAEYLRAYPQFERRDFLRRDGQYVDESKERYNERRLSEVAHIEKDEGSVRSKTATDIIIKSVSQAFEQVE